MTWSDLPPRAPSTSVLLSCAFVWMDPAQPRMTHEFLSLDLGRWSNPSSLIHSVNVWEVPSECQALYWALG